MPQKRKDNIPTVEKVLAHCYQLGIEDLLLVRDALDILLEQLERSEGTEIDEDNRKNGFGYIEKKMINNCGPYCYLRFRRNGIHHSLYLGKERDSSI